MINNRYMSRAAITVEAVYIVPVILMITITFIYAIMIGHDRGVVHMELRRYAEKTCFDPTVDMEPIDIAGIQNRLLIHRVDSATGTKDGSKLNISAHISCKVKPIFTFGSLKKLLDYNINFKQKYNNICKNTRKTVMIIG